MGAAAEKVVRGGASSHEEVGLERVWRRVASGKAWPGISSLWRKLDLLSLRTVPGSYLDDGELIKRIGYNGTKRRANSP